MNQPSPLLAGAASVDLTPRDSVFLAGYPHVRRYSTGVHDPLLSASLYLQSGSEKVLLIANDVIYVSKALVTRARARIARETGVPEGNILISATHTHSGPKTLDNLCTEADEAVPPTDPSIVRQLENGIVESGCAAVRSAVPAELGLATADATGVGTNRRDPDGPRDLEVPVLIVRSADTHQPLSAMLICSMHPTVLHEDSTFISGDFPAMARQHLQKHALGGDCVILYHTGPAGNQSPRHVTRGNTFAEAERLGAILAQSVEKAIPSIRYERNVALTCRSAAVDLPLRSFASEAEAQQKLARAIERLDRLRKTGAGRTEVRTAEVDWFGAEETLTLARAFASGRLQAIARTAMPAEVQVIGINEWSFVAWPGEMFVEFALAVKARRPGTFCISYANGELQGYLVTKQAADEGGYESSNAIFRSPDSGDQLVAETLRLLENRVR